MRILHTNFHKDRVGESQRILDKVWGLQQRGHYVLLASPAVSAISQMARQLGLEVFDQVRFSRGFDPYSDFKDILYLRDLIRAKGINIVHTHGSKDSWVGALAARWAGQQVRVVRTRHNMFPVSRHPLNRWLYRRLCHKVVAISGAIQQGLLVGGFLPPHKLALIHSGVDPNQYHLGISGNGVRQELGLSPNELLVGMVASIVPYKGHQYFLEAAAQVLNQLPQSRFLVVGSGRQREEQRLAQQAQALGLGERLKLTGQRADIPQVLAALDVFVMPSLSEGLGLATIEALAMQKPVVATRVGGIPETVRHMETGLLVPPRDTDRLSEAIITLLRDKKLAQRLAKNGRKLVVEEFSTTALMNKTEQMYQELVNSKKLTTENTENHREKS